ncbi:GNAT family N-acetyltransferase [Rhizobium sp. GCM10022189]|uniref:GNAT family N-acetyltransferase n=1 Tax=Rhizobium sp. GCM10022189 TaxID=3252654 RepID=UPI003624552C
MREYAIALWDSWPSNLSCRPSIEECQIVMVDGRDVGCVTVERHYDHLWLDELYIPTSQRKGIGSIVLTGVIADAERVEMPLRLSVLTTNPAAADFYLRHGFRIRQQTAERLYLEVGG